MDRCEDVFTRREDDLSDSSPQLGRKTSTRNRRCTPTKPIPTAASPMTQPPSLRSTPSLSQLNRSSSQKLSRCASTNSTPTKSAPQQPPPPHPSPSPPNTRTWSSGALPKYPVAVPCKPSSSAAASDAPTADTEVPLCLVERSIFLTCVDPLVSGSQMVELEREVLRG